MAGNRRQRRDRTRKSPAESNKTLKIRWAIIRIKVKKCTLNSEHQVKIKKKKKVPRGGKKEEGK